MSRAQVASLKSMTILRLQLQATVIVFQLLWNDEVVVMQRVGEIQENNDIISRHWIPSKLNVTDEATWDRIEALHLKSRWFKSSESL